MEYIEKLPEIMENMNPKAKPHMYKFMASLALADDKTYEKMNKHNINPVLGSQFKAYVADERSAEQIIDLGERMEFIDELRKNPNLITDADAKTDIIKSMGQQYSNENTSDNMISFNDYNVENNEKKDKIKEDAQKLLEVFTLTSDKVRDAIMMAIDEMNVDELSEKEVLMTTFAKTFAVGNVELLSTEIDRVIDANTLGRRVA